MNKSGFKLIDNSSLSSNFEGNEIDVSEADYGSIHIEWSGVSPVGEIIVEAKSGEDDTYSQVDMGGPVTITGTSGDHQLIFNSLPFTKLKLRYSRTSGSGNLTAIIVTKRDGGIA